MGQIKNKTRYPVKIKPSLRDYFIGSDIQANGKTVNFEVSSIVSLLNGAGQQNQIISGSPVWISGTLSFYIPEITYILSGNLLSTLPTTVTLDDGGSLPRIDVIAVTIDGEVYVQRGVESPVPQKPTLPNGTDYLELTFVTIDAFGTTPEGMYTDVVYDENTGEPSEYTATEDTGGNGITLDYMTLEPFSGIKVIRLLRGTIPDGTITFTNDAPVTFDGGDVLQIAILKHEIFDPNIKLEVSLYNGATQVTDKLTLNSSVFGFNNNLLDAYQFIVVPLSHFTTTDTEYNIIKIKVTNIPYSDTYIDRVVRVIGLNTPPPLAKTDLNYVASPTVGTITSSTGTSATIPVVGAINSGLMIPADKTKLDNLTVISSTTDVPEGTRLYFTVARVLATVLTGLSLATGGSIVATDTILVAFGKIQNQLNALVTAVGLKQDILTDTLLGNLINSLGTKSVPADADTTVLSDSADSNKAKRISFLSLFNYIKSKSDTEVSYACSDEASELAVGTLITFRMPYAMTLSQIKLSLNVAPTVSKVIVDIKENGASIFSTLASVDTGSTTSVGASVPAVISDVNLANDSIITISTTQVGSGSAGKGLKVTFIGRRP